MSRPPGESLYEGSHIEKRAYIMLPEPLLKRLTSSYTPARPTRTYTIHSTWGQEPKIMPPTFQLPPIKPPRPISPQFKASRKSNIQLAIFKPFICSDT